MGIASHQEQFLQQTGVTRIPLDNLTRAEDPRDSSGSFNRHLTHMSEDVTGLIAH
ncbi:hypothetical protein [Bradyrhizobium prioriisuperbiae]|uniref:hypothetical protein n=1 Tax=Bradyrhizobium prioriisuperbiae TaxID=2854389 RepID=UPI0028EA85D9|nr:hypothetical protein [Bradyrhizobium prioritasuperba]